MTTAEKKQQLLNELYEPYKQCIQCPLGRTDAHPFIFGSGNPDAKIMIVGEAPGRQEEEQGMPFVGKSGQLLTKTLDSLGIDRSDIFITNIVKCRPQKNRTPSKKEIAAYTELLYDQISIINPIAICTLGSVATYALLASTKKIRELRGTINFHKTIQIIPTYHPAYILRNSSKSTVFKQDIQKAFNLTNNS